MKILLAGFSVLTRSLHDALSNSAPKGIDMKIFGLGGHHFNHLYPWIDLILQGEHPEVVILDLASTPCRRWATDASISAHVHTMLARFKAEGIRVGFAHLYRRDYDPKADAVCETLNRIAREMGLPVYNIAEWSSRLPAEIEKAIYFDGVHVSESGAGIVASRLFSAVTDFMVPDWGAIDGDVKLDQYIGRLKANNAATLVQNGARYSSRVQSRYGVTCEVVQIPEGDTAVFTPPKGQAIVSFYPVFGRVSGALQIESDESSEIVTVYDGHCYYDRLHHVALKKPKVDQSIRITQLSGVPDVKLLKGSPDMSPRIGEIGMIVTRE